MTKIRIPALLGGLAFLIFACNESTPVAASTGLPQDFDIRGEIIGIALPGAGTVVAVVDIKGEIEADTEYDEASVRITPATRVFDRREGDPVEVSFNNLSVDQRVEAAFIGDVMESDPVQATASVIVIIG